MGNTTGKPRVMIISHIKRGVSHYVCHLKEFLGKDYKLYFATYKEDYFTGETINSVTDELTKLYIKKPLFIIQVDRPHNVHELVDKIKKLKIDLINIQFSPAPQVLFYYYFFIKEMKKLGIPVIMTIHEVFSFGRIPYDIEALKLVYNNMVSHFIVGTRKEKHKLKNFFKIPNNKISIVLHGIYNKFDRKLFDKEKARKFLKIKNKNMVLFFGNYRSSKGGIYLIKSMKYVIKKEPNSLCYMIGSERVEKGLVDKYRKAVKKLKLSRNVRVIKEYVDLKKLEALFKACDVVAMPYIHVSQSGILELAFIFKKPVIITNLFDEAKLVKNKKIGLVVKPKDVKGLSKAIVYFFRNKEIGEQYGLNGYNYGMKYRSWKKAALQMKKVFDSEL